MSEFLNKAISAHYAWKTRLRDAMAFPASLDAAQIESDCLCDLGRWIHGSTGSHRGTAEFECVEVKHAEFHKVAAQVVRMMQSGKKDEAEKSLEAGAFANASTSVVAAISVLKKKMAGAP